MGVPETICKNADATRAKQSEQLCEELSTLLETLLSWIFYYSSMDFELCLTISNESELFLNVTKYS